MPTAAISGCNGSVTGVGGAGAVGTEITNWSATIEAEKIEATSFDSGCFQEWIQGVKSCEGSFEGIGDAPVQGDVATLTLDVSTAPGAFRISGPAIIFSVAPNVQVKGSAVTYSANFSFTGAFTIGVVP
jgi:hypothetical protein